jgi:hypothetical protein
MALRHLPLRQLETLAAAIAAVVGAAACETVAKPQLPMRPIVGREKRMAAAVPANAAAQARNDARRVKPTLLLRRLSRSQHQQGSRLVRVSSQIAAVSWPAVQTTIEAVAGVSVAVQMRAAAEQQQCRQQSETKARQRQKLTVRRPASLREPFR